MIDRATNQVGHLDMGLTDRSLSMRPPYWWTVSMKSITSIHHALISSLPTCPLFDCLVSIIIKIPNVNLYTLSYVIISPLPSKDTVLLVLTKTKWEYGIYFLTLLRKLCFHRFGLVLKYSDWKSKNQVFRLKGISVQKTYNKQYFTSTISLWILNNIEF